MYWKQGFGFKRWHCAVSMGLLGFFFWDAFSIQWNLAKEKNAIRNIKGNSNIKKKHKKALVSYCLDGLDFEVIRSLCLQWSVIC